MASEIAWDSAGFDISSQRRGVTPLVLLLKRWGYNSRQVLDRHRAQQLRMNRRNTVRAMRADDSKVGHPNFSLGTFFYKAYALNASLIFGKAPSNLIN